MASDPWVDPQDGASGQSLGHLNIFFFPFFSFIELLAIELHILVLFRTGFPGVTLDLRVHGPGWD